MISLGFLDPHEVPDFCALFKRVFGTEMPHGLRDWKYVQGPRLGAVSVVARDSAGALVGHAGALIFPGRWQGRALPMAQVCDVMVDAGVRGGLEAGGVYEQLMHTLRQHLRQTHPGVLAYGFAGIRPYRLGARMGLYRLIQSCRTGWLSDLDPGDSRAPTHAVSAGAAATQTQLSPLALSSLRAWWAGRWSAVPAVPDASAFATVWRALQDAPGGPRLDRTPAYLHWRYACHPVNSYQTWLLRRRGRPRGWLVTRTMPDGSILIVDALLPSTLSPVHAALCLSETLVSQVGPGHPLRDARAALRLGGWCIETYDSARLEPIMACEVAVDGWHDGAAPVFHPGDTDVF